MTKKQEIQNPEGEPLEAGALPQEQDPFAQMAEQNRKLMEMVSGQAREIEKIKYSRGNPHRERMWDQMNSKDENVILGNVPSFDRKDPIVFSSSRNEAGESYGTAWVDEEGKVRDTQAVFVRTKSGVEKKLRLKELSAMTHGNSIPAKCVDWLEVKRKMREIDKLKCDFQKMVVTKSMRVTPREILNDIEAKEKTLTMKIILSDDLGKTYSGMELEVPMYTWNSYP